MLTFSRNRRLVIFLVIIAALLCLPLIGMVFTSEVNWNVADFAVAGALLTGTALGIEFILRVVKKPTHRILLAMTALLVLIVLWIEIAVGLFGSPIAGS
ncbi:MAG: hypothetical protein P8P74_01160 [Crocinitomicaceae bacterium]|nr:hypothetical protein [Crocinitomicaceae bacterium]